MKHMKKLLVALLLAALLVPVLAMPSAQAAWTDLPYWIGVDSVAQQVTIYRVADNQPVYRWICSTDTSRMTGSYTMPPEQSSANRTDEFKSSGDGSYYRWASTIRGSILFHSYLYTAKDPTAVDLQSVRDLGKPVSHGCIRLVPDAAKWIALNCLPGTRVIMHRGFSDPLIRDVLNREPDFPLTGLENAPTGIRITANETIVPLGGTVSLTATVAPAGVETHVTWVSSNKAVASVSQTGIVTGHKSGVVSITALTDNGVRDEVTIEVNDPLTPRRLELDADDAVDLQIGGPQLTVHASVIPDTAPQAVTWTSDNTRVAAVSSDGVITPLRAGKAVVTCTAAANGVTLRRKITVNVTDPTIATGIVLTPNGQAEMKVEETLALSWKVLPDTAVTTVSFTSSASAIASVSKEGVVTARKAGKVTITAKTANGRTDKLTLTITDPYAASSIRLSPAGTINMLLGESMKLTWQTVPETAAARVTLRSSLSRVISADNDGTITALAAGRATVTARTANGKTAAVTVVVTDPTVATGITLVSPRKLDMIVGQSLQLQWQLTPDTATTPVSLKSSMPKVVTAANDGTLTALKAGTAVITVKTTNGKSITANVTVTDPYAATGITVAPGGKVTMLLGDTLQLKWQLTPEISTTPVTVSSSMPRVVSAANDGTLTALKAGTAVITVKTANGKSARVNITVVDPTVATGITLSAERKVNMIIGTTMQLQWQLIPGTATTPVTVKSNLPRIVSAANDGTLTALKTGTAIITVKTANGKSATVTVTVTDPYAATGIAVTPSGTVNMLLGDTLQLQWQLTPENSTTPVTVTSSMPKVVSAANDGTLTALKAGTASVTVKTANGKSARVSVIVTDPTVATGISLTTESKVTMLLGEMLQVKWQLIPDTATTPVTLTSSLPRVVSAANGGTLTALKAGTATITVKTANGKSAKVAVTVVDPSVPTGVTLEQTGTLTLVCGRTLQLNAVVQPSTAVQTIKWSSSASTCASVNSEGVVTGIKSGVTVTITAATVNGKKATVRVRVVAPIPATGIVINEAEEDPTELTEGDKLQLTCTVAPAGSTPLLTWESDDEDVVTVDDRGEVTAVGAGTAVVTVTTDNGLTAEITITVTAVQEPKDPEASVEPEEPEQSETPDEPAEPEQPEEPAEPVEPEQPEEPAMPVEPEQPEEPADPAEPEQPDGPAQPAATPTDLD